MTTASPAIGAVARRSRTVSARDIELFTEITGDRNPLHYDAARAEASRFGGVIVQGGVTSGLLNAVVAEDLPGPGSVFLHVDWRFLHPVRPGDTITATVTVAGTKVTMQVTNAATGRSVTKVKRMAAPDVSSAEWVAEAPSLCSGGYCRTVTLSDFGKVRFTNARATSLDGHTGSISDRTWTATSIQLAADSRGRDYGYRYDAYDATPSATPTALSARA